jgi:hypothetical protein
MSEANAFGNQRQVRIHIETLREITRLYPVTDPNEPHQEQEHHQESAHHSRHPPFGLREEREVGEKHHDVARWNQVPKGRLATRIAHIDDRIQKRPHREEGQRR